MYTIALRARPTTSGASSPLRPEKAIATRKMKVPANSVRSFARIAGQVNRTAGNRWEPRRWRVSRPEVTRERRRLASLALAADRRAGVGRDAAGLELEVQVRPDRQACAPDKADLLALLDLLAHRHGHLFHVRVDLDQAVAVRHLDPEAEVVRVTGRGHLAARGGEDGRAVAGEEVDAGAEGQVDAVSRPGR